MQVAEALAPDNVQLVNVPVLFVVSVIVPVGVKAGVGDVSVTVTVQVAGLFRSVGCWAPNCDCACSKRRGYCSACSTARGVNVVALIVACDGVCACSGRCERY